MMCIADYHGRETTAKTQHPIQLVLASMMILASAEGWSGTSPFPASASFETAQNLVAACGSKQNREKLSCYEQGLFSVLTRSGVNAALDTLAAAAKSDRDVQRDGHVYAHFVGISAYQGDNDVGEIFRSCSGLFQSGCYHGVIQSYLEDVLDPSMVVTAERINGVCQVYQSDVTSQFLRFQCLHALGHGLTAFYSHDLPKALRGCDALSADWDQHGCYSGAFMENAVHGTGLQHSCLHHHVPHSSASAKPVEFAPVRAGDPHYPCSVLEDKYLSDCYLMQTSIILYQNHGDFRGAAAVCDAAPITMRPWCYQGLGRDASSYTLQDPDDSIRLCSLGDPRYQPWCYVGLVKNFIDLTAKSENGFAFCPAVPGRANQLKCYEAVGEEIWGLALERTRRATLCRQAGAEAESACRYGARLQSYRPPALPIAGRLRIRLQETCSSVRHMH